MPQVPTRLRLVKGLLPCLKAVSADLAARLAAASVVTQSQMLRPGACC